MNQELKIKALISDIEKKWDKNLKPFYQLSLSGCSNRFYAFSYGLPQETLTILSETPEQLINHLALISYQELPNKGNSGTFYKVKHIEIV